MHAPQAEHDWLHRMVGTWTYEAGMGDMVSKGREVVTSLGGLWIIGEGVGEMPGGGEGHTRITLGYDTSRQRFAGSWVGSMMSCIFFYDGALEGDVLTLEAEGPAFAEDCSFIPDKRVMYRDVFTLNGDDERILTSFSQDEDGAWTEFMRATYRRQ